MMEYGWSKDWIRWNLTFREAAYYLMEAVIWRYGGTRR